MAKVQLLKIKALAGHSTVSAKEGEIPSNADFRMTAVENMKLPAPRTNPETPLI